jgi:hypothetical protein
MCLVLNNEELINVKQSDVMRRIAGESGTVEMEEEGE